AAGTAAADARHTGGSIAALLCGFRAALLGRWSASRCRASGDGRSACVRSGWSCLPLCLSGRRFGCSHFAAACFLRVWCPPPLPPYCSRSLASVVNVVGGSSPRSLLLRLIGLYAIRVTAKAVL
ncbi:unnamed protein product, partial [Ectocarpus sp. 8 AP-2014]